MALIPEDIVQNILEAANIEEIVGDFVNLRKRGSNMIGLCPFHNEKTPSFTVSPNRNIFKCFGCGKGGNPARFLMEHEQLSFPEALRTLAKRYGIAIPEIDDSDEAKERRDLYDSLHLANQFAQEHFVKNLSETEEGKNIGLSYFYERGYRDNTIEKFGLGYSLDKRWTLKNALEKAGYDQQYFEKVGLVKSKEGSSYDFFNARVMFPIHSLSGKVIAFGGRTLSKDKKVPKYVNSPESEVYNKSKTLYGIHLAKKAIRNENNCYLVEGYTDVISMHQAGIENVVASSGTSLTEDQVKLLSRFSKNVTILFDGDAAGIKASLRGVDLLLEQDLNVKVAPLPEDEDPDSFVTKLGNTAFTEWMAEHAKDFIFFKTGLLSEEAADDPVQKSEVVKSIVVSLSKIPDNIKRALYVKECSKIIGIEEKILIGEINKVKRNFLQKTFRQNPQDPSLEELVADIKKAPSQGERIDELKALNKKTIEQEMIRFLLLYADLPMSEEMNVLEYFLSGMQSVDVYLDENPFRGIMDMFVASYQNKKVLDSEYFINHSDEGIAMLCTDLISTEHAVSENWLAMHQIVVESEADKFKYAANMVLKRFMFMQVMDKLAENEERMKNTDFDSDLQMQFLKTQKRLLEYKTGLSAELGMVTNPI